MSPEPATVPYDVSLDCTYTVSVYPGYGVELKVSGRLWVECGDKCLQASVACPLLRAAAVWPCTARQTGSPVLVPVPVSLSQESRLRAWTWVHGLGPLTAAAGTHH